MTENLIKQIELATTSAITGLGPQLMRHINNNDIFNWAVLSDNGLKAQQAFSPGQHPGLKRMLQLRPERAKEQTLNKIYIRLIFHIRLTMKAITGFSARLCSVKNANSIAKTKENKTLQIQQDLNIALRAEVISISAGSYFNLGRKLFRSRAKRISISPETLT